MTTTKDTPHTATQGASESSELDWELLVGNLVAATVAECESHEQDESDADKDAAADRFIRAKDRLLRAVRSLVHPTPEPNAEELQAICLSAVGGAPPNYALAGWRAAIAQRQPAPADPQAPSQEARTVDHLPGTTGDSLEDAMKWAASQEAREYPPLPQAARTDFHWIGDPNPRPYFTADQMRSYVDSDRKARQQEAQHWKDAVERAARVMRGEGVNDQGEAWDQCLRILDAAIAKGPSHE